jgi:polysaccharide deacetylase 2 family uncharacterized protein YibQ
MTENTEIDADSGANPGDAKRSLKAVLRAYAGWLVFSGLMLAVVCGLCIALFSQSLQINAPSDVRSTVPRKVVPLPETHSAWPGQTVAVLTPPQTPMTMPPAVEPAKKPEPIVTAVAVPSPVVMPAASTSKPPTLKSLDDRHSAHFKTPVIAIVIDDMGLDRRHSNQMVDLPAAITLAYMPYAQQVGKQTDAARQNGHELIVHMPMEPDDLAHNNPGPDALLIKNGEAENVRRLDKNLMAFSGYMGINNHMGSALTSDRTSIMPILHDLKNRGLWFLDSKTDARSVAANVASEIDLPYASRDVFLDNVNSRDAVLKQLQQTEWVARHKGYAIAIGHPKEGTVTALQAWVNDVQNRGFVLVPLSTIIAARFPNAAVPRYAKVNNARLAQTP